MPLFGIKLNSYFQLLNLKFKQKLNICKSHINKSIKISGTKRFQKSKIDKCNKTHKQFLSQNNTSTALRPSIHCYHLTKNKLTT